MGFRSPGPQEISQTLLAVGDRLSGIILENRKLKMREEETRAELKQKERDFKLRERALSLRELTRGGAEGEGPDGGKVLLNMTRAREEMKFLRSDWERDYINNNGGEQFFDMDLVDLKRRVSDVNRSILRLDEELADIKNTASAGKIEEVRDRLIKERDAARGLIQNLVRARETDTGLEQQMEQLRKLARGGTDQDTAPPPVERATATPSAPTVPVDATQDIPQNPELDAIRMPDRDQLMLRIKEKATDDDILLGAQAVLRGLPPKQANAALESIVRDVMNTEGIPRAREIQKLFSNNLGKLYGSKP